MTASKHLPPVRGEGEKMKIGLIDVDSKIPNGIDENIGIPQSQGRSGEFVQSLAGQAR